MTGIKRARIPGKGARSTIYDVARLARVSTGTVSHVLNGTAPISEETRLRVMACIRELGYSRNENARALRTSDSKIIGVVLQDIASEYYAQCTARILQRAQAEGFAVLTTDAHFSPEVLKTGVSALVNRRVNGLIFVGGSHDRESYEMAAAAGVPIVFGDRFVENYPCVQFNNRQTMSRLVRALYSQGYREFFYYGEDLASQQNLEERFGGFRDALESLGIPQADCEWELSAELSSGKMRKAFNHFRIWNQRRPLGEKPRIVMTSNDMIAQGVIAAALRAGLQVPRDIAVFGFDNISIASCTNPSISTVVQDPYLLGDACFEMLIRRMSAPTDAIDNLMLHQKIALRESTALADQRALDEGLELYRDEDE